MSGRPAAGKPLSGRELLHVSSRAAWRAWLAAHHATAKEVWLVFHKTHTGKSRVHYAEAVEEALCFGWIDSVVKRIDDEKYARKFTPRRAGSRWSELNKGRVRQLIAAGLMTDTGRAMVDPAEFTAKPAPRAAARPRLSTLEPPAYLVRALKQNKRAWETFSAFAPSHRGAYVLWITQAKREETRERRIREAVALLAAGRKLPLK